MLIDTHCHLHDAGAFPDADEVIARASDAGIGHLVAVGVQPGDWESALRLAEAHANVSAILGWHPNYTARASDEGFARLESLLSHPKVRALGEIGLDYHWDYADRQTQAEALLRQIEIASRLCIPIVLHCREAYGDLLDMLERARPERCLFHCWAGSREDAARAVALGCFFGVDGPITYKSADALRDTIADIPRDRLVLETDSPYMPPVPYRGKRNEPAYLVHVNQALSSVIGLTDQECALLTTGNAKAFFGLE